MSRSIEWICEEMARRRSAQSPLIDQMIAVRDRYNADVVVPVPDTDDDVPLNSLAPLLIADAVDNAALYAAQVCPTISVPALEMNKLTGQRSTDFASRRRKALYMAWDHSWWDLVLARFFRHLAGYAQSALVVELDETARMPKMTTRDPLSAYPEPKAPEDLTPPTNCGFITGHSIDWLHRNYPETANRFPRGSGYAAPSGDNGELWDIVEWMDEDEIVIGVLGPRDTYRKWWAEPDGGYAYELARYPNELGRCPAVVPRRVTLDRIVSQLANLTGHADMIARLLYLDIRATERSVFPDRYVLSKVGQSPTLAGGQWLSGETGEINLVTDADAIGELRATPDPNNKTTMDRIERNLRVSSGTVPQMGGETYGALRTGRGIDALTGAALDPRTIELHRIAERYLGQVCEMMLIGYRKAWGSKTYAVSSPLDPGGVDFTPNKHVEMTEDGLDTKVCVYYPIPGMDEINATQVIGQMMGVGLISSYDGRRMHPYIRDPEGTERRQLSEQIQQMQLAALGMRAQSGELTEIDLAQIQISVEGGERLSQAVLDADKAARERQATQAPPESPQAQPGLANPGMGAEAGGPVQQPPSNLSRLQQLYSALNATGTGG